MEESIEDQLKTNCTCDQTSDWVIHNADECLPEGCMTYNIVVIFVYSMTLVYFAILLIYSLRTAPSGSFIKKKKRTFEIKTIILSLLCLACVLRIVRYAVLLDTSFDPRKILQIMRVLYSIPLFIAFCGLALLVFCWIQVYYSVLKEMHPQEAKGKFMRYYIISMLIVFLCYILIISIEAALHPPLIEALWNATVGIVAGIGCIYYGKKIWNSAVGTFVNNNSRNSTSHLFKKYYSFSIRVSIALLFSVTGTIILTFIYTFTGKHLTMFLLTQMGYRVLELIPFWLIGASFQPEKEQCIEFIQSRRSLPKKKSESIKNNIELPAIETKFVQVGPTPHPSQESVGSV